MAQLDQTQATGGVIFNVKFSPDALSTEEALDDTVEVVKSYFRNGGAQIDQSGRLCAFKTVHHGDQER